MSAIIFKSKYGEGTFGVAERKLSIGGNDFCFPFLQAERPKRLYIIFSKQCNLRCSYCFQNGEEKKPLKIDTDEILSYVASMQNRINEIVLFGGEPLLDANYDIISSILRRFDYLQFIVFTNGNFGPRYREVITRYSYCIQAVILTIDGPKDVHNRRRFNPVADSFDTIISNLKYLQDNGITLDVQVNVDKSNIGSIEQLLQEVSKDSLLSKIDYTLNPVKYIKDTIAYDRFFDLYFDLLGRYKLRLFANNRMIQNLSYLLAQRPTLKDRCALASTYVLNLPEKTLYSCPQNSTSVIGHIFDKQIMIDNTVISELLSSVKFERNKCVCCEYSYLCPYGCPYVSNDSDCQQGTAKLLDIAFSNFDSLVILSPLLQRVLDDY